MTGDHITEPLDYLYEELSPEGMAEARRHLASCPDCRREMRAIRETVKLYREMPRPTAPDRLADRAAAAALAGLARPAVAQDARSAPAEAAAPASDPAPVLYPPPPRTPLPYPDMEKEFARLKEEVMRDAPKGLRSWLFHPAWTVAASVIFLCALLMHLSPRMQASRTMVIPAAPTRSDEAARQIRLRERIPPSEPRSASSPPAGEPPPILSEAEAINRLDLEQLLAEDDEPPRGKFTLTRVNPTALLEDTPQEASLDKKMDITATPGGWVASGTGAGNVVASPPDIPVPAAALSVEAPQASTAAGSPAPAPKPSLTGTAPAQQPPRSEPSAAGAGLHSGGGEDGSTSLTRETGSTRGDMSAPPPASLAPSVTAYHAASPVAPPSMPEAVTPQGFSAGTAAASSGEEAGPVVSSPLATDGDAAFDGLIVDWEDMENPPQIVPRPTPLDVPERIRTLAALVGVQIAHREWGDAWRTVALVEAYDKQAAENLRSLVRTAQDADREAVPAATADGETSADQPAALDSGTASPAAPKAATGDRSTATTPETSEPADGHGDQPVPDHPLRPEEGRSGRENEVPDATGSFSDATSGAVVGAVSSGAAGSPVHREPVPATNSPAGSVPASGKPGKDSMWQDVPVPAVARGKASMISEDERVVPPPTPTAPPSASVAGENGAAVWSGPTGQTVPSAPPPVNAGTRVTPVYSSGPGGSYVAEPIIMPPIVMDPSGRMPRVVLLTQEQAAELHAAGRLQYAVPPTVIPAPEVATATDTEPGTASFLTTPTGVAETAPLPPSAPTVIPAPEPRQSSQPRERPKGFSTDPYVRGY
ncbi:MAG: zf-HC2 domain-containing protein [Planctomycetes bacterium]|nr:zf-HC2 domain-containing protein [Planctomycetota bacterium]